MVDLAPVSRDGSECGAQIKQCLAFLGVGIEAGVEGLGDWRAAPFWP